MESGTQNYMPGIGAWEDFMYFVSVILKCTNHFHGAISYQKDTKLEPLFIKLFDISYRFFFP